MNKKVVLVFALIAVLAGIGLFVFGGKDTQAPTSTPASTEAPAPTSTPVPTSTPAPTQTPTPQFTISTFTAEVEYYKSINNIPEADKIPEDGLAGLYNHLKGIAKMDPNLVENEDNEYFAGYLEWYNTAGKEEDLRGKETDIVPPEIQQQQEELNKYKDEKLKEVMTEIHQNYTPEEVQKLEELFEYLPAKKDDVVSTREQYNDSDFNFWLEGLISDADRLISSIKNEEALRQANTSGKDKEFFEKHGH